MTDDLRARAREAAGEGRWGSIIATEAFADGALWHATQRPTREQVARAIHADDLLRDGGDSWDDQDPHLRDWYLNNADAVLALWDGAGS